MWQFSLIYLLVVCTTATPSGTFSCDVTDGEHVYDLNALSVAGHWKYVENLHTFGQKKVFYLSICHPLRSVPNFCDSGSTGVCASKLISESDKNETEIVLTSNAGQIANSGLMVTPEGWLVYNYDHGGKCIRNGKEVSYKTSVNFMCPNRGSKPALTPGPVLMSSPNCEYIFAWMTEHACPKKMVSANISSCVVQFSNSDHDLNLHSLHAPSYYNVTSHEFIFELNICGPITSGHCSNKNATVCEVSNPQKPHVLGTLDGMTLEWTTTDYLKLIYHYESITVEVQLFCSRTSLAPKCYYVSSNSTHYTFSIRTATVCDPAPADCIVHDKKGNVFDLRPLRKLSGNWEALDSRPSHENLLYHINVCDRVNEDQIYQCPSGPVGACQTSVSSNAAFSMGLTTSHPTVNADGSITVLYTGGDQCQLGKHSRSTRLNLICDPVEHGPSFVEETDTCEYLFTWLTPAACPRHSVTGSACQVMDPLYGAHFDLTALRNNADYNVSDGVNKYRLNMCGPLINACEGQTGVSGVCQGEGQGEVSAGLASGNLTFNDGTLTMDFVNGSSRNCDGNRSAHILFMCDHSEQSINEGLHFLHDYNCSYHFVWRTNLACPPFNVVDCTVENGTSFYDLSDLSSANLNEEFFSSDHSTKYIMNVCRSVVHSKSSRCPYSAGICAIDLQHKNGAINWGNVHSGPFLEKGKLKLKYTNGDLCNGTQTRMETIVEFVCDPKDLYSYPQLISEEDCRLIFEWSTSHACPVTPLPKPAGNCTVTNPYTGYTFDMNSLKLASGYEVSDETDLHLWLNICDKINRPGCGKQSGACSSHDNNSDSSHGVHEAGEFTAVLNYHHPGTVFLEYRGGEACKNGSPRTTIISFICGAEGSQEGPILVQNEESNSCTYFVHWVTELACERRVECFAEAYNRRIDLSSLTLHHANYELLNPVNTSQKFILNICRPVNPTPGLNCNPGAAACLIDTDGSSAINLGHPVITPQDAGDEGVMIMYSHGTVCPTNDNIDITTKITFQCNKTAGIGWPKFQELTHDCQYQFNWPTSVVCPEEENHNLNQQCQYEISNLNSTIDLHPLTHHGGYIVDFNKQKYILNICEAVCNTSGVCTVEGESYGLNATSELVWDGHRLKLTYYGGDICHTALSGKKTTAIYFECDPQGGFGEPHPDDIMVDLECMAVFRWRTNVTCVNTSIIVEPINPADTNNKGKSSLPPQEATSNSQSSIVASILIVCGLLFVAGFAICHSGRGRRMLGILKDHCTVPGYAILHRRPQSENSNLLTGFHPSATISSPSNPSLIFRISDDDDDLLRV